MKCYDRNDYWIQGEMRDVPYAEKEEMAEQRPACY